MLTEGKMGGKTVAGTKKGPWGPEREAGPRSGSQVNADSEQWQSEMFPEPWLCCVPSLLVFYYPDHLIDVFLSATGFCEMRQRGRREEI